MIFNDIVELKCVCQSTHSLRTFEYFFPLSSTHNVMVVPLMGALDSSNLNVATIVFNVSFCLFVCLFSFNVVAYTL